MDFNEELKKINIKPNKIIESKFNIYYNELIETNKYMNLTAITNHDEVYIKHFLDSLALYNIINKDGEISLCDVGSGAGFPSIPLAIVMDNLKVTIIDSLNKRINFLNNLKEKLDLNNVIALHKRAEEYIEGREIFDYVTARAVARLNVLLELCMPLVKLNGYFIAMKSIEADEELKEASKAISKLGGIIEKEIDYDLPFDYGKRRLIIIKKVKSTPSIYPRKFKDIKDKPL